MTAALYSPHNTSRSLSSLLLSSDMLHRCIYSMSLCVKDMMDANYRLRDKGAATGLLVERSEGWSGSRSFAVFCIMSVLVTSPSLQIGNDMCEPLLRGTFN